MRVHRPQRIIGMYMLASLIASMYVCTEILAHTSHVNVCIYTHTLLLTSMYKMEIIPAWQYT